MHNDKEYTSALTSLHILHWYYRRKINVNRYSENFFFLSNEFTDIFCPYQFFQNYLTFQFFLQTGSNEFRMHPWQDSTLLSRTFCMIKQKYAATAFKNFDIANFKVVRKWSKKSYAIKTIMN